MIQVRIGNVSSVDDGLVKVAFPDLDDLVSGPLPVLNKWALKNKSHWMPDIKEQVVCVFFGGNLEDGIVLGSLSNNDAKLPSTDPDLAYMVFSDGLAVSHNRRDSITSMAFSDGSQLQYQAQQNLLVGDFKGTAVLDFEGDVTVTTPNFNIVGNLNVDGNISSTQQVRDFKRTMELDRNLFNVHDHNSGDPKTSKPNSRQ